MFVPVKEFIFVFLLFGNHSALNTPIEIGGFHTEKECQQQRTEILKDVPKFYQVSRCFKVYK